MADTRPPAPACVPVTGAPTSDLHRSYKIDPRPHQGFARMVARVVARKAGFRAGSAEEAELEAVAYLTICKHARRFKRSLVRRNSTPEQAFQGWIKRDLKTECQRAAEKIKKRGVTQAPPAAPYRCRTCTEFLQGVQADSRPWHEDEEADEPLILPAPSPAGSPRPAAATRPRPFRR
jgi:hypothetical protein